MGGKGARLEGSGERRVRVSLLFLHSIWVSAVTPLPAGQAHWGTASAGWLWPLDSGHLLRLPLQPRSGSSFLLVLISLSPGWWLSVFHHLLWNQSPTLNSLHVNTESHFCISGWALMDVEGCQGSRYLNWFLKGKKKYAGSIQSILNALGNVRLWGWRSRRDRPPRQWGAAEDFQKGDKVCRSFRKLTWLTLLSTDC